ncbi:MULTISPECIES: hypothetical protein [Citrobacter freundii complex]|uniref:hypothetical protein n=1 Tax=Citrobacter freundii complex TaxID=1344959 RepID=UPI0022450274|nr:MULTISPECIES: hypothetical protein [Citrobacter freundii complex]MCX2448224.1 hypothetical protein [Citrobacter freundii complex sp. 2022EL-00822]MCX2486839.1 hypothetical protein [Citrobacter freundii complex sp. 2022EL-00971]MDF0506940.1 hypothetical protein [Citrobacter freundii]WFZ30446.1 hypothetical protein NFK62_06375 [Citrobacter portucalensis]WFZ35446.1 hypothetical protein NFK63_06365 [Citrobacter portucalensis]
MSETKNTTPFSQQLAYINKGTLDAELTETLAEVIKAVRETGKKGDVTLKLNCAMLNTRDENTMKVTPKVTRTIPELDRADTIMFATADGDLLRDDPAQTQLDLKVIEPAPQTAPIKLAQ